MTETHKPYWNYQKWPACVGLSKIGRFGRVHTVCGARTRIISGGAVGADAGALGPVRPGGAARGGGDRATAFDTQEHFVLLGSAFDPRGTTEGGLIVSNCPVEHCTGYINIGE